MTTTTMTMQGYDNTGIFCDRIWVNYKDTVPNQIVSFTEKGTKNSKFAADCRSENFKYKNEWPMHKFQKTRSEEG